MPHRAKPQTVYVGGRDEERQRQTDRHAERQRERRAGTGRRLGGGIPEQAIYKNASGNSNSDSTRAHTHALCGGFSV